MSVSCKITRRLLGAYCVGANADDISAWEPLEKPTRRKVEPVSPSLDIIWRARAASRRHNILPTRIQGQEEDGLRCKKKCARIQFTTEALWPNREKISYAFIYRGQIPCIKSSWERLPVNRSVKAGVCTLSSENKVKVNGWRVISPSF